MQKKYLNTVGENYLTVLTVIREIKSFEEQSSGNSAQLHLSSISLT